MKVNIRKQIQFYVSADVIRYALNLRYTSLQAYKSFLEKNLITFNIITEQNPKKRRFYMRCT